MKEPPVCSICRLPIPWGIVNPNHPLFGTIDHVIPLSKGGANSAANRRPAHRYCNARKRSGPIRAELVVDCRTVIVGVFTRSPALWPRGRRSRALLRAAGVQLSRTPIYKFPRKGSQ